MHNRMRKRARQDSASCSVAVVMATSFFPLFLFVFFSSCLAPFLSFPFVNQYSIKYKVVRVLRGEIYHSLNADLISIRWSSRAAGRRSSPLPGRNFPLRHHHSGELTDKQPFWDRSRNNVSNRFFFFFFLLSSLFFCEGLFDVQNVDESERRVRLCAPKKVQHFAQL